MFHLPEEYGPPGNICWAPSAQIVEQKPFPNSGPGPITIHQPTAATYRPNDEITAQWTTTSQQLLPSIQTLEQQPNIIYERLDEYPSWTYTATYAKEIPKKTEDSGIIVQLFYLNACLKDLSVMAHREARTFLSRKKKKLNPTTNSIWNSLNVNIRF